MNYEEMSRRVERIEYLNQQKECLEKLSSIKKFDSAGVFSSSYNSHKMALNVINSEPVIMLMNNLALAQIAKIHKEISELEA